MNINSESSEIKNSPQRRLTRFFGLLLLISIPIWIISALTKQFIPEGLPINHIGFILVFAPAIVAFILNYRDYGKETAKKLLKRAFDYKRIEHKIWYLPILFLLPIMSFLTLGLIIILGMQFNENSITFEILPLLFIVFIIFAIGEEVGWQGYVFDAMQTKWKNLNSAIILGIIWPIWHIPLFIIQEPPAGLIWILSQCLYMVVLRVLIVWIFNNTNRSIFGAILIHAISNLCTMILPIYSIPLATLITSLMIIITLIIGISLKKIKK
ncbi:MAG: CPBP family intramembrane glutamic endopeptidase [Promethearchaeota archaeon]